MASWEPDGKELVDPGSGIRSYSVPAHATATARIDVEAASEEEANAIAKGIGGFEIRDVDELLDFVVEDEAEAL